MNLIPEDISTQLKKGGGIYNMSVKEFKSIIEKYKDCDNAKSFYGTLLQLLILDNYMGNTSKTIMEKAKILLESGADININDDEYLDECDSTMQWNDDNKMPIHLLCMFSKYENVKPINKELIDLLLDYGADINSRDSHGFTPILYINYFYEDIELFKHLLKRGADIHAFNYNGYNILHILCRKHYVTKHFKKYYSNKSKNTDSYSKIYQEEYNTEQNILNNVLDICLEHGLDINSICLDFDKTVQTPLSLSIFYNSYVLIELLIEKGATITDELINYLNKQLKINKKETPIIQRIYNRIMELEQQKTLFKRAHVEPDSEDDDQEDPEEEDDIDNDEDDDQQYLEP